MHHTTKLSVAAFGMAGLLALAGCGSTSNTPNQAPAAAGETTVGESAPMAYTDTRYHYQMDAPGHMTANSDGTASFIGPSERLEIAIVTGSAAADPAALANQDSKSLSTSAPSFHLLSSPATVNLNGHDVTRFSFTWNAGTSAVTGK